MCAKELPKYLESPLTLGAWLAPKMNAVHGVDYSEQFWSRLVLQYCRSVLQQIDYYKGNEFQFPAAYCPILGPKPPDARTIRKDKILSLFRSFGSIQSIDVASRKIPAGASITIGVRGQSLAEAVNGIYFKCNWMPYVFQYDRGARERLRKLADKESTQVGQNILNNVPKIFVEHFLPLAKSTFALSRRGISKIYVEHFGSIYDRFLAYLLSEHGAKFVQMQTGGYMGETQLSVSPRKRFEYDVLLTYGWSIGKQDCPFFAVRLHEFAERYFMAKSDIAEIDVLAVYDRAQTRAKQNYYRQCTKLLCRHLAGPQYATVRLRPRGTTRLLSSRKSLIPYGPTKNVDLDPGKEPLASLCRRSKVVVHWTHPSTNFLECIFVDHPVLAVWTEKKVTDIVRPYYEFFLKEGVLHDTPDSLVSHLNSVDVVGWWNDIRGCPEYSEFKSKFARSRKEFLRSGTDILSNIENVS